MASSPLVLLPAPPVRSVDSHRVLIRSARRKETALARERWKQSQVSPQTQSRARRYPHSAPPGAGLQRLLRSGDVTSQRPTTAGRPDTNTNTNPQFPFLEREIIKRDLTQRLPYFTPVHVEPRQPLDYPTQSTDYSYVFFLNTHANKSRAKEAAAKDAASRRHFIHPEWASEKVSWVRFQHKTYPDRFRFSWM